MIGQVNIFDSPLIVGAVLALIATIPPYLVYRHSRRVDAAAAETGSFAQIMAGLNNIIQLTQADNVEMRTRIGALDERLSKAFSDLTDCAAEKAHLKVRLTALESKYGITP